jgi:hypothetical protein
MLLSSLNCCEVMFLALKTLKSPGVALFWRPPLAILGFLGFKLTF